MNKKSVSVVLGQMNVKAFFFILFAYQLIFVFQGVDLADAGFYGTFYQQIFTAPETVQYGFMYWFSGIVGGAFVSIFPDSGMLGLRVMGVSVTTSTLIITYNLLKKYLDPGHLKLGLLIVTIFMGNNPEELNYNNLSSLLYISTAWFLFTGLRDKKQGKIFLSGLFIAFAAFTRLPNILGLGLGIAILYHGYVNKTAIKYQIRQIIAFAAGFVSAVAIILLFMKLIGHLTVFMNAVKLVFMMGKGGTAESPYGIVNLLKQAWNPYFSSLKYTLFVFAGLLAVVLIMNFIKTRFSYLKQLIKILKYLMLAIFLFVIVRDKADSTLLLYLFAGVTLITSLLLFVTSTHTEIKTLLLIGVFVLLVYPFGSSSGLFTVGVYTFWLTIPIVVDFIFNTNTVGNDFFFTNKNLKYSLNFTIPEHQLSRIRNYGLLICILSCLFFAYYYPYFDRHERIKMHYAIDNDLMRGIYTSKDRADRINELLSESNKYIKPGDYVLAYDCIPMFHYMTRTKPYMRNPWPYLYESGVFKQELDLAFNTTRVLPVVIYQKIKNMGNGSDWPSFTSANDPEWPQRNKVRNGHINDFLVNNHYQEVWSNEIFKILIPTK